jgi:hypothetical protein
MNRSTPAFELRGLNCSAGGHSMLLFAPSTAEYEQTAFHKLEK